MPNYKAPPCVIYARGSRWDDTEAISQQIDECQRYAREQGYKVMRRDFRENTSGYNTPLHKRHKLLFMMQYMKEHGIKVLLVRDISRLSRSVLQGAYLLHWCQRAGIVIHDIELVRKKNCAPDLGWNYIKELYSRLIAAEDYHHTHINRPGKQTDSNILYIGKKPPFGYKAPGKLPARLEKNPETSGVVGIIFQAALKNVSKAHIINKNGARINYTKLHGLLKSDADLLSGSQDTMDGAPPPLSSPRSLTTFLQNSIYAGYTDIDKEKVHDAYISVRDYNRLNRGWKTIQVTPSRLPSYVSLISCGCGDGKLNKHGYYAVCPKCEKRIRISKLDDLIGTELRKYYLDKDHNLYRSMAQTLKIGLFKVLLSDIRASCEAVIESDKVIMDNQAAKHAGSDGRAFVEKLNAFISELDGYRNVHTGEMAVEWLENCSDGDPGELIRAYELNIEYRFDTEGHECLEVRQCNAAIPSYGQPRNPTALPKLPLLENYRPLPPEDLKRILAERKMHHTRIIGMLNDMPELKAVLAYDLGFAGGDFITPYEDTLKP